MASSPAEKTVVMDGRLEGCLELVLRYDGREVANDWSAPGLGGLFRWWTRKDLSQWRYFQRMKRLTFPVGIVQLVFDFFQITVRILADIRVANHISNLRLQHQGDGIVEMPSE